MCRYCKSEVNTFQFITRHHLKVCPQYPIQCTNEGCGQKVPRSQMIAHKESCPKEIIFCEYSTIGCVETMKREEQEEHNEQSIDEHLQMAVKEIADLKISLSQHIRFGEFNKRKSNNEEWCSPGFYTSPGGYKMSLDVDANGSGNGKGTHVSYYIFLMSGEYDDVLEWPFQGEVTIELLNQLEDRNHHRDTIEFDESTPHQYKERVVGKLCSGTGWGCDRFISHSQLGYNSSLNCQYLKDDTLYFRISVKVTSTTKPWLVGH